MPSVAKLTFVPKALIRTFVVLNAKQEHYYFKVAFRDFLLSAALTVNMNEMLC